MAETQRTRAALLALYADNTTGQISAQDFRDGVISWMPVEFAFVGDFWVQPLPSQISSSDRTGRGAMIYSQVAGSDISFGAPIFFNSNEWVNADVTNSLLNPALGIAMDSYTSNDTTVQVLKRGIVIHSVLSARFSDNVGRPVYLQSGSPGSISVTITTDSVAALGYVELESDGGTSNVWRFEPGDWAVKGD